MAASSPCDTTTTSRSQGCRAYQRKPFVSEELCNLTCTFLAGGLNREMEAMLIDRNTSILRKAWTKRYCWLLFPFVFPFFMSILDFTVRWEYLVQYIPVGAWIQKFWFQRGREVVGKKLWTARILHKYGKYVNTLTRQVVPGTRYGTRYQVVTHLPLDLVHADLVGTWYLVLIPGLWCNIQRHVARGVNTGMGGSRVPGTW